MATKKRTTFSDSYILEIAQKVNQGQCAFVPVSGEEPFFSPDYRNPTETWSDEWRLVFRRLRFEEDAYFEVAPPEGKDIYWHMQTFMQKQQSAQAQRVLSDALATKSPFSSFRAAVEKLGLTSQWESYRFPQIVEHTKGAFNLRQPASLARIISYHPEFKDHADF